MMQYIFTTPDDGGPTREALRPPDGAESPENLYSGYVWDNSQQGLTLYYSFWQSLPSYYTGADAESNQFQPFTPLMRKAALEALGLIETFVNVAFVETNIESQAHIGFGQSGLNLNTAAWAYFPSSNPKGGDVWTNHAYVQDQDVAQGEYAFYTILHEIGHAMGLQHTSTGGLRGDLDTERYSVMAYDWSPWNSIFAETYMLYDIYALQQLYGANTGYNAGNTVYTLLPGHAYTIWDGGGIDTLDGAAVTTDITLNLDAGTFSSVGLFKNIAIAYDTLIENATGGMGDDTFYGNAANNILTGNNGNDIFYASKGNDTISGGFGDDTVIYSADISNFFFRFVSTAIVIIEDLAQNLGKDTLLSIENFIFDGASYTRTELETYAGAVTANTILIRTISDTGEEDIVISQAPEVRTIDDAIALQRTEESLTLTFLQNGELAGVRVDGSSSDDTILLVGDDNIDLGIRLTGGAGADILAVQDMKSDDEIFGDGGEDMLLGGAGNDRLHGGDDNDTLFGEEGDDILNGDAGDDFLDGGLGNDLLLGHDGSDTLNGGEGNDFLYGMFGDDVLNGQEGDDFLYGGNENDNLNGGVGNDTLEGEIGNDALDGGEGNDYLFGSYGDDILNGSMGDDILQAGPGIDSLNGGEGSDYLYGHDENDILNGGAGDDFLYGGNGEDTLTGGAGTDFLTGNAGSDTFVLDNSGGIDKIQDFQLTGAEKDKIDISEILTGFDDSNNIADFVVLDYVNAGRTDLRINADGQGHDFQTIATIKGSDLFGVTAADLMDEGQIILNNFLL